MFFAKLKIRPNEDELAIIELDGDYYKATKLNSKKLYGLSSEDFNVTFNMKDVLVELFKEISILRKDIERINNGN